MKINRADSTRLQNLSELFQLLIRKENCRRKNSNIEIDLFK